ncbi:MAG: helix-turn-helix transcriptional regulator [Bacteroidetes bacterium]|nr:helix-turn-helix transcriptional regulator [Bacteroidota bacterium]
MQDPTLLERTDTKLLDKYANVLKALAHPIRMAIVDLLHQKEGMTVTQIYEKLRLEQAVASHHLGILRDKGVLEHYRVGKHTYYYLEKQNMLNIIRLVEQSA